MTTLKIENGQINLGISPSGIMFHHFHGGSHKKSQGSISAEELDRIILSLKKYKILAPDEWLYKANKNKLSEKEICFTFDDNLMCQYEVALPVLDSHEIKAFWFVYTSPHEGVLEKLEIYRTFRHYYFENMDRFYEDFEFNLSRMFPKIYLKLNGIGFDPDSYLAGYHYLSDSDKRFRFIRDELLGPETYFAVMDHMIANDGLTHEKLSENLWMSATELTELFRSGHQIGLHTHTHPTKLSAMPTDLQQYEFYQNQKILANILGLIPSTASFPNNSYNDQTLEVLDRLKVSVCFSATPKRDILNKQVYPRHNHVSLLKLLTSTHH